MGPRLLLGKYFVMFLFIICSEPFTFGFQEKLITDDFWAFQASGSGGHPWPHWTNPDSTRLNQTQPD